MKINWKVRFKNRVFLAAFFSLIISFVFDLLELFEVVPMVNETLVGQLVSIVLMILTGFGVITDPTTSGVNDSTRAMTYTTPYKSENG